MQKTYQIRFSKELLDDIPQLRGAHHNEISEGNEKDGEEKECYQPPGN